MKFLISILLLMPLYGVAEPDLLAPILAKLAHCESRNKVTAYNKADPYTPSYGLFQYKEKSWRYFIKKYNLFPEAEAAELMNLIWDREAQTIVTRVVINNEKNWQRHWRNCVNMLNLKYV